VSVDAQARDVQARDAQVHSAESLEAQKAHHGVRCFKCPKERRGSDPGWYFTDVQDRRGGGLGWLRVYVCPRDYASFAESERPRWTSVFEMPPGLPTVEPPPLPVFSGPEELIEALSRRGLSGWVFLVKDVAEGRVRRIHLRQLPADPEIRQALMSYLQSAGTHISLGPGLLRRPPRDPAGSGHGETFSG
jgi:hypothetical protein